jgi:Mg-chelatase subunit ChlD
MAGRKIHQFCDFCGEKKLMITLLHPIWLLLAIPLLAAWWLWKPSSHFLRHMRLIIILLILLAISGLALKLPSRAGTMVVVADRSLSMPAGSDAAEKEAIELIQRAMGDDDRLSVVSFGQNAAIERAPQTGAFAGFTNQVERDASNLTDAIEKAMALIPVDSPGKILVISDGQWTGKDPSIAASKAAMRSIAIDYRSLQRSTANDLAIAQIDAPVTVTPGEAFMITAWVKAPAQQAIGFELRRGGQTGQTLASGRATVATGLNRLTFRDTAGDPGTQGYALIITGNGDDPVPENNAAKILVGIQGPRPLLVLTSTANSGLARLLAAGGMKIKTLQMEQTGQTGQGEWSLDELAQYSGLLIENVSAQKIGERGMETIATWVTETGAGMMMTGGKNAYGPGGYFKSPLEPVMPVSMELRQEHRKLSLAMVVAMDRSGSMTVPVAGNRTKMDLANLAAVQVLDLLSPNDEFGVIAVDSTSHIIADLNTVDVNAGLRNRILQIDSGGNGIFIYEALTAAADMMLKAKAGTRHILLFADAADSEEPGKYQELLKQCEAAGITVSVIGLGKPSDQDADLLRDIAKRGNGQIYFTESASELPRLFAQDTIVVARSTFLEEPAQVQFTGGLVTLTGKQLSNAPKIGGYNLTYLRPKANLAALTTDQYQAPVAAAWQAGSGRVLCYTGEADGAYTGSMAGWKDAGEFFTSLARWTAGEGKELPGNMLITQEVRNGVSVIRLHLDPEKDEVETGRASLSELPNVTTLRGVAGSKPASERTEMYWSSADTLEVDIPLRGSETALSSVEVPGAGRITLAPVALPYSSEYKPASGEEGESALARLAQATGGKERIDLAGVWRDLPRKMRMIEVAPWLLILATLLLLVEVLERHSGLITSRLLPSLERAGRTRIHRVELKKKEAKQPQSVEEPASEIEREEAPVEKSEPAEILGALQQARQQAKERIQKNQ